MSSDSEIAVTYREIRQERKERKEKRLENANEEGWEKHTPYHWYRMVKGKKLNYWPSTGLCMYNGKRMNINGKRVKQLLEQSQ